MVDREGEAEPRAPGRVQGETVAARAQHAAGQHGHSAGARTHRDATAVQLAPARHRAGARAICRPTAYAMISWVIFHFTLLNYFRRSGVRIPTPWPFRASVMKVSRDQKCVQMEIVCFVNNEIVCVQPR